MAKEKEVMQEVQEEKKIELTKEELDALISKTKAETTQEIAMTQAKANAKAALEEEVKAAQQANLDIFNTKKLLNEQKQYRVVIHPAAGDDDAKVGSLSINGVKYKFKYNEETVLPAAAIELLKNSMTYGKPELVQERDKYGHVIATALKSKKVQKRTFNSEAL